MKETLQTSRSQIKLLLTALALVFAAACGQFETDLEISERCLEEAGTCQVNVFLEVDEFEFLRRNGALVLDTRSAEEFVQGHVPGSINASWRPFANTDYCNGLIWNDTDILEAAARSYGINNDDTVIVLGAGDGQGGDAAAGRLFWTLEYLGHDKVYLVNGGFNAWVEAGFSGLHAGETTAPEGDFVVNLRPERRATKEEVEAAIEDGSIRLVDTRTIHEYEGDEEWRRGNPELGFIPESIHFHWEDALVDGKLRPRDELLAEFEALGILPGTLTIPYCQTGVRSGYFYAILKWLDYPEPKNYDGSWWEWSRELDEDNAQLVACRENHQ